MARLNEPPAPAIESIDALKRRFIRQNREIARVNSTQSQRIRNLESEISRLLAENVAIRQEAIAAVAEAERWRAASRLGREVSELKTRLDGKLREVTALVDELGGLPEKATRRNTIAQRKIASDTDEREHRTRPTSNGDLEGQDGRLPAILEDKYYPRRTFENEQLRLLTTMANAKNDDTESPDLGPPPVAHFEAPEPIAFDSSKSPKTISGGMIVNEEDLAVLSKNLETRRKRRTSSLLHEMPNLQDEEQPSSNTGANLPSRPASSTKRKFDASETANEPVQMSHNDDFVFQRKDVDRPRPSRFAARPIDRQQQTDGAQIATSPQRDNEQRRILGPKSTNSPSKKMVTVQLKEPETSKNNKSATHRSTTRRTAAPKPINIESDQLETFDSDVHELQYAPKTPAANFEDMISPPLSAMDTLPKAKSTEAAIINSVEDVLNGSIGRGSRRARAAMSYAEPNLRDKMRRPDKKLVGAVEGLNKSGNTTDRDPSLEETRERSNDPSQSTDRIRVIRIKSEKRPGDEMDGRWKDLPEAEPKEDEEEGPASPSRNRERSAASRTAEVRKKRTHSESEGTKTTSKPTRHVVDPAEETLDKAVSRLSIFDPPTSSPISPQTEQESRLRPTTKKPPPIPMTTTQQPQSSTTMASHNREKDNNNTTIERPSGATSRTRRYSTQPQPATHNPTTERVGGGGGLSRSTSTTSMRDSTTTTGKENMYNQSTTSKLKRAGSVQTMADARTMGSRRRSMMV